MHYAERPELRIIDDALWNRVQDRLERTHLHFTADRNTLNDSHRARYLLNSILRCGCCGGGFTLVGRERYGCFTRKSKGATVCDNRKTITRDRVEARVLARIRSGLLTPELATIFAEEVKRIMEEGAAETSSANDQQRLEAELRKIEASIARLLDRLESDEPGEALVARLKEREAEQRHLRVRIAERMAVADPRLLPGSEEILAIYRAQVARLDRLLMGTPQIVEANALLREILGEVVLRPDQDAQDGMAVELRGDLGQILQSCGAESRKGLRLEALFRLVQISVVAGGRNHLYLRSSGGHLPLGAAPDAEETAADGGNFLSALFRTAA